MGQQQSQTSFSSISSKKTTRKSPVVEIDQEVSMELDHQRESLVEISVDDKIIPYLHDQERVEQMYSRSENEIKNQSLPVLPLLNLNSRKFEDTVQYRKIMRINEQLEGDKITFGSRLNTNMHCITPNSSSSSTKYAKQIGFKN